MLRKLRAEINSFITKQEAICRKNLAKQWGQYHYEFEFLSTFDIYDVSFNSLDYKVNIFKVRSVQEPCVKCFVVNILRFAILKTTWKNKKHQNARSIDKKLKTKSSLFNFLHLNCKISNFNMWTAKRLAQASCTDFTLKYFVKSIV